MAAMSVSTHLGINLAEYDRRIRSFVPYYETMLDVAASAVPPNAGVILDLGIGTGALAQRCAASAPRARVVGIDADAGMMALAGKRLGDRATFVTGSFLRTPLPRADAVVASLALHHVRTRSAKAQLYGRIARALGRRGRLIVADCFPARDRALAQVQRGDWEAHLARHYSTRQARQFLAAWSHEDTYMPLEVELNLIRNAGLHPEVLWRKGAFAVLVGL